MSETTDHIRAWLETAAGYLMRNSAAPPAMPEDIRDLRWEFNDPRSLAEREACANPPGLTLIAELFDGRTITVTRGADGGLSA